MANETGPSGQLINPYKLLTIKLGNEDWMKVLAPGGEPLKYFAPGLANCMVLDDELKVDVTSTYDKALEKLLDKVKNSTGGKALSAVRGISSLAAGLGEKSESSGDTDSARAGVLSKMTVMPPNVRYQTTLAQLPSWTKTEPIHFNKFTFKFHLGMAGEWNARTEVYNPVVALATVNLPTKLGSTRLIGPLPSTPYIYGQLGSELASVASGIASSAFGSAGSNDTENQYNFEQELDRQMGSIEGRMRSLMSGWSGIIQVNIGNRLKLPEFAVAKTSYTFSQETDDKGFPIWGEVTWDEIQSIQVAHKGLSAYQLYGSDDTTAPAGSSKGDGA